MQKGILKGFAAGLLAGLSIVNGITYAANYSKNLEIYYRDIRIVADGKEVHPADAKGNLVEPFISGGTTYLPVRAVADSLGKAVYWDGPSYTVYLGDMDGELEYPTLAIENAQNISDNSMKKTNSLTDNYGNKYNSAIYSSYPYSYSNPHVVTHEYLLDMKYSHFKGTLYIPQGETQDDTVTFSVIADGKNLYTSPAMSKSSRPVEFDINITGCNDIKISFSSANYYLALCLGDAGFYQ